jgi:hypothetical protein
MFTAAPAMLFAIAIVLRAFDGAMHWFNSLDRQGWFFLLCGALVMGAFFLRGFGSRKNY